MVLRHTTASAVLTENFFMDSHPDCTFLLSPEDYVDMWQAYYEKVTDKDKNMLPL